MTPDDPVLTDAARAVLDNTPIDWSDLESSDDLETRGLTEQLKVLSTVSNLHRQPLQTMLHTEPAHWGRLEVFERVGTGASGAVYRAYDPRLNREVALKLLPAGSATDASSPIVREGRLLTRVRHSGVATIYGTELIDGRVGLWMEFVHGRTLEQLLGAGHQFGPPEVISIGVALADAVSAVHDAGLLHRDIKAQNVMRADDGRTVLMDFGTGWDRFQSGSRAAGTPLYLAPEIFRGAPATPQSDVYSIGVLLFRLLTGDYPVEGRSIDELREAHDQQRGRDLGRIRPDLPTALVHAVRRAIAAEPAARHRRCTELAAELRAAGGPRPYWPRRVVIAIAGAVGLRIRY